MKEIRFEIRIRRDPYFMAPIGKVQGVSQTVHVPSDELLQLWRLTGPPDDLERIKSELEEPGRDPHKGNIVLHETNRSLHVVAKWGQPIPKQDEPTLENLFATLAWSQTLLRIRGSEGQVRVRALDEDAETLRDLYHRIEDRFGDRWEVRLARFGSLKREDRDDRVLSADELELIELALDRGYYDDPKGCGVRELGEELGMSKSAVNRKLRALERQALEALRQRGSRWPTEDEETLARNVSPEA